MNKNQILAVVIAGLLVAGGAYYLLVQKNSIDTVDTEDQVFVFPERKIEGNTEDLVYFSVSPNDDVSGILNFSGTVKNAYFFEANIGINILDQNKKLLKAGYGTATTDWMTSGPVSFEGTIDLTSLPEDLSYIQIAN